MDKYDIIAAIGRAFDERDAARLEAQSLKRELSSARAAVNIEPTSEEQPDEFALVRANVFQTGKRKVFEDALSYWKGVTANRGDDGQIRVTCFDRWAEKVIDRLPGYMSKDQFKSFFSTELESLYEAEKAKAVDELRKKETEEAEDVD